MFLELIYRSFTIGLSINCKSLLSISFINDRNRLS